MSKHHKSEGGATEASERELLSKFQEIFTACYKNSSPKNLDFRGIKWKNFKQIRTLPAFDTENQRDVVVKFVKLPVEDGKVIESSCGVIAWQTQGDGVVVEVENDMERPEKKDSTIGGKIRKFLGLEGSRQVGLINEGDSSDSQYDYPPLELLNSKARIKQVMTEVKIFHETSKLSKSQFFVKLYEAYLVTERQVWLALEPCVLDISALKQFILDEDKKTSRKPLPKHHEYGFVPEMVYHLLAPIVSALADLHDKVKYVHLDVKSENILLDHSGVPKLTDYGTSMPVMDAEKGVRKLVGTPYFMAPEVYRGDELSVKADVFSLGVTIYDMLWPYRSVLFSVDFGTLQNFYRRVPELIATNNEEKIVHEWENLTCINVSPIYPSLNQENTERKDEWNEVLMLMKSLLNMNPRKRPTMGNLLLRKPFQAFHQNWQESFDLQSEISPGFSRRNGHIRSLIDSYKRCLKEKFTEDLL